MVNGADEPVVLLAQNALAANTSLASLAGTYDLLRYQTDTTGGGQTRSSYVTSNSGAHAHDQLFLQRGRHRDPGPKLVVADDCYLELAAAQDS
uniref:Uncharacterized protein n=1 Tax=Thiomonas intermedia (strain K12) TaxID=75379 RepID=D5WYU4_THIK1